MPSGITGRNGFLPALVKSIRRSFPCRHPTTGGSLKGSPAGTPLTHRFLYYPYSTTAAAVCQPSFCPGPQPAGRRDGPSGEFARNVGLSNRVGLCVLVGVAVGPPGLAEPYHSGVLLAYFIRENGDFASVFRYREKSPFGQQKSPIYSGFSQETSFLSPHYGGPEGIRTLDLSDANRTLSQLSYKPEYEIVWLRYVRLALPAELWAHVPDA